MSGKIEDEKQSTALGDLKQSLFQLLAANEHWKKEWKAVVRSLIEHAQITNTNTSTSLLDGDGRQMVLRFHGIDSVSAVIDNQKITWLYRSDKQEYGELFNIVRDKLQSSVVPKNLRIMVLNAIYRGLSVQCSQENFTWYGGGESSSVFILGQHFNPNYLNQSWTKIIPDRWNEINDYWTSQANGQVAWDKQFPKIGTEIDRSQMTKLIHLLFRHDKLKRDLAINWMWQFFYTYDSSTTSFVRIVDNVESVFIFTQHFTLDEISTLTNWMVMLEVRKYRVDELVQQTIF